MRKFLLVSFSMTLRTFHWPIAESYASACEFAQINISLRTANRHTLSDGRAYVMDSLNSRLTTAFGMFGATFVID